MKDVELNVSMKQLSSTVPKENLASFFTTVLIKSLFRAI